MQCELNCYDGEQLQVSLSADDVGLPSDVVIADAPNHAVVGAAGAMFADVAAVGVVVAGVVDVMVDDAVVAGVVVDGVELADVALAVLCLFWGLIKERNRPLLFVYRDLLTELYNC